MQGIINPLDFIGCYFQNILLDGSDFRHVDILFRNLKKVEIQKSIISLFYHWLEKAYRKEK